jgi:hypothetical protein
MRSQKIRNRAPRPFKNKGEGKDWSGGGGFIPAPKKPFLSRPKPATESPEGEKEKLLESSADS